MAEWMNDLQKKQWRTFTRNRIAVIGMFLSLGMLLMAVFAPQLSTFDPLAQDIHMRLHAPDGPFVLGTDDFGRDVLSRIFWGARISLTIGIGSVLFGMVLGSAMGMLAGLRGGRLGAFIMRCADTMMCFPAEILAILILVVLGQGVDKMLITIGLVMTPRFARLSYGSTLALREREFIEADLALGASTLYVLRQGILPNIMGELLVMSSLWAATAIRVEANLSFLGMGVSPPTPTWGNMVREGIEHLSTAPWLSFAPPPGDHGHCARADPARRRYARRHGPEAARLGGPGVERTRKAPEPDSRAVSRQFPYRFSGRLPMEGKRLLEIKDLHTVFHTDDGAVRAVDGVDLWVDEGEVLGLVGESGCGKSVTAHSVMQLVSPPGRIESGEILFRGRNLLKVSEGDASGTRQPDRHDLSGAHELTQSAAPGGHADRGGRHHAYAQDKARGVGACCGHAPRGGHPGPGTPGTRLPPPAFRGYAPARDDRNGHGVQPPADDRR